MLLSTGLDLPRSTEFDEMRKLPKGAIGPLKN